MSSSVLPRPYANVWEPILFELWPVLLLPRPRAKRPDPHRALHRASRGVRGRSSGAERERGARRTQGCRRRVVVVVVVVATARGGQELTTEDGTAYYWNHTTQETSWESRVRAAGESKRGLAQLQLSPRIAALSLNASARARIRQPAVPGGARRQASAAEPRGPCTVAVLPVLWGCPSKIRRRPPLTPLNPDPWLWLALTFLVFDYRALANLNPRLLFFSCFWGFSRPCARPPGRQSVRCSVACPSHPAPPSSLD